MMPMLATLLLAHLIADFPLQGNWIYRLKLHSLAGLAIHAAVHILVTALMLSNPLGCWQVLLLIGVTHFAIDWLKLHWRGAAVFGFLIDQAAHMLVSSLLATIYPNESALPNELLYPALAYAILPAALMALWIGANSQRSDNGLKRWMRCRLLGVSQIMGLPLVVILPMRLFMPFA